MRPDAVPARCRRASAGPDAVPVVCARGVTDGTVAVVCQAGAVLRVTWEGPPGAVARLRAHLGADAPLDAVEATLARDPVLRRLLPQTSGLALMRQDPWECLLSYVVSAFNNIPKIRTSIERLARAFGAPIAGARAWSFPAPARLADARPAALRACLLGYRAPYVRALARLVADGEVELDRVGTLPYDEARRLLLALPGVGEKVADCVLLFAYGMGEAFPVDVWVQRAVETWYFAGRPQTPRAIRAWARDRFGPLAGYAQQHLYAAARARRLRGGPVL
jgi:N-glycosylase/DNA lyase